MIDKPSRIVVADAESASRQALGEMLMGHGYAAALAATAGEALHLVAEDSSGLLLVDLSLAGAAAYGLLARMQSAFPGVPVVLAARLDDVPLAARLVDDGADAYAVKPLEPAELSLLLGRVLAQRRIVDRSRPSTITASVVVPGASLEDIERDAILKTVEACGGSTSKAASVLRISARTVQYKLKQYRADTEVPTRGLGGTERRG